MRRSVIHRTIWAFGCFGLILGTVCVTPQLTAQQKDAKKTETATVDDVSWVDELVKERWKDSEIKPSAAASDGEFVRRVFLDIVGHVPSIDEAKEYIDSRDKNKKAKLIQKLLSDDYTEDYTKYWATIWSNLLIGRTPGRDIDKGAMMKYLRDAFAQNKPWDKLVYELVTATGGSTTKSTAEGVPFNGATNFMLSHMNDGKVPATSFTTRLFLGMQVQCTQCHDHPFNDRKQESFWGINAFLQKMDKQDYTDRSDTGQRIFLFSELKDDPVAENADLFVRYDKRSALVEVTPPAWIDGKTKIIEPNAGMNLRERLAQLIVAEDNPYFAQAIVNRMWAHFLGRGIVHPLDDLGEHNPPSNPELLDKLASNFKESNYDLKRLITWITMSLPYSLSSQSNKSNKEDDALFSHYPLKQMSPEQFFDSLMVVTITDKAAKADWDKADKLRDQLLRQFTTVFNNDENAEADTFNGTIPQALLLMNGELIAKATSKEKGSLLRERVDEILKKPGRAADVTLLNDLYLVAVSRRPTEKEKTLAHRLIQDTLAKSKDKDPIDAYQDILWALLNSSEFVLNH
jgi:hypothetical protein